MGYPVISDATPDIISRMVDVFGTIPFKRVQGDLATTIDALRFKPAYDQMAMIGRQHYCDWHSPQAVAERAIKLYNRATRIRNATKTPLGPAQTRNEKLVLVKYLGQSVGTQTWFPEGRTPPTQYLFSTQTAYRYVYEPDVAWFLKQRDGKDRPLFEVAE